jgi:heme exporter protein B
MSVVFRQIATLIWKDLLIDLRRKENFLSMLMFSTLTLLLFQFAMGDNQRTFLFALPGIIWVVFLLTGVLSITKSIQIEMEDGCMEGLLLLPIDRTVLFLGKMLANSLFLILSQSIFLALCFLFFPLRLENWGMVPGLLLAATLGFSSIGTLLAAMTATLRGREVLVPVLLFPLMVPALLSLVNLTNYAFFGFNAEQTASWWRLLLGLDVLFLVTSGLAFEFVLED